MYYQLKYYYKNREKILNKQKEISLKRNNLNHIWNVKKVSNRVGRPRKENPLKKEISFKQIFNPSLKVKKGIYNLYFN